MIGSVIVLIAIGAIILFAVQMERGIADINRNLEEIAAVLREKSS